MRKYDLYIIESSFIDYYYGKERVIFNLFKDYEEAKGSLKKVLARQIEYITEPIPILKIHNQLEKKFQERHEFFIKDGVFYLQESKGHAG